MEQAGTEQRTPGPAPRPPPSYLTPPDEPQPLDFSSKRPRLSPPASPSLPGRALPPRRLVSGPPAPALPSSPLPLTLLQHNLKTLTSLHQQPSPKLDTVMCSLTRCCVTAFAFSAFLLVKLTNLSFLQKTKLFFPY